MQRLILLIFIILCSCAQSAYDLNNSQYYNSNISSANIGSGPVELLPECVKQFNEYISMQKSGELSTYDFAFAVSTGGTCGWFATEEGLNVTMNVVLSECNNLAKENGWPKCKIFAKNRSIVWDWNALPDYLKGGRNVISFADVEAIIGKGKVKLSEEVQYYFDDYLNTIESTNLTFAVFVISPDGKYYSTTYATEDHADIAKRKATAECMTVNSGNQCYLYAINDKIIWKN